MVLHGSKKKGSVRSFLISSLVVISLFPLSACDLAQNYLKADREGNLEQQDYRDALSSRVEHESEKESSESSLASIPDLQPYIAQAPTNMKPMPLVSVSVNQSVPLRDILFELAEQADYDVELDPRIRGSIIFTARNRPFDQVVERIAEIAGLRYKFKDDILRVELDTPYNKLYKIDYLSYIRESKSGISTDVSVVSGDGADTGSSFEAKSESEINFWGELEANLEQILGGDTAGALRTNRDPRITATEQNPDVQAVAPDGDGNVQVSAPDAVLRVDSLPVDDEDTSSSSSSSSSEEGGPTFGLNKQAGLVNVYANEKAQKKVQEYLTALRKAVTAQVLIEAKVLEVTLNDQHSTGISWDSVLGGEFLAEFATAGSPVAGSNLNLNSVKTVGGLLPAGTVQAFGRNQGDVFSGNNNFALGYAGNDVDAVIQALSGFGTVKALASPRLTVLNNQPAMLNVSTNQVFFEIDIDVSQDGVTSQTDISSEVRNVPEGVLINVQPSINLDHGTVAMAVRPTITEVVNEVPDPAVQFVTASAVPPITGVVSNVPELNVQEIDSVIQVRSGQPVVMGGLLQDRVTGVREGVPVLGELPVAGALFRTQDDLIQKTELVIFLKATILDTPGESVHNTDKDLYRRFSSDRRPLKF